MNEDQSAFETVEEMPFSGNCISEGSVHIRIVNKLYHIYACKHLKKKYMLKNLNVLKIMHMMPNDV